MGFMYHSNKKECGVNSCAPFMGFCPLPSPTGPIGPQGITGPTGALYDPFSALEASNSSATISDQR